MAEMDSCCSSTRVQMCAVGQALLIYMISEWLLVSVIEYELSRYPAFSVFCQQLFIVAIMGVAVLARFVNVQFYEWAVIFQIAVLALLICFSILLRGQREFNEFLWMIEYAARALLTVVFVFFLTDKLPPAYKMFNVTIFSMGIGLVMYGGSVETCSASFFLIMCATLFATVAEYTLAESIFDFCKVTVNSLLLWTSVMLVVAMLPMIFVLGEHNQVIDHYNEIGYEMVETMVPSCILAFARNYSLFVLIEQQSSVYAAVVTSSLAPLQVIANQKFSPNFSKLNYVGIAVTLITLLPYHYNEFCENLNKRHKYQSLQEQQQQQHQHQHQHLYPQQQHHHHGHHQEHDPHQAQQRRRQRRP